MKEKLKRSKGKFVFIVLGLLFVTSFSVFAQTKNEKKEYNSVAEYPTIEYENLTEQKKIIWEYYDTVNQRDKNESGNWKRRVELTAPSQKEIREIFSKDESNQKLHLGIFNLKNSRIVYLEKIQSEHTKENSGGVFENYLVGYESEVYEDEDIFTFSGVNFDEVELQKINGKWYIYGNYSVEISQLEKLNEEILTEKAIEKSEMSRMTSTTYNPVVSRPELIELVPEHEKALFLRDAEMQTYNGISVIAKDENNLRTTIFSMQSCYSNVEPAVIFVAMRNAKVSLETPTFDYYLRAVLEKEMGYSYDNIKGKIPGITEKQYNEALKATAMAIKMYGWFRCSIVAKHKSESAHVCNTDCCQVYPEELVDPDRNHREAIISIHGELVRTNYSWLLYGAHYSRADKDPEKWKNAGQSKTGNFLQDGAFYLAKQRNYNYKELLSYYYANVPEGTKLPYPAYPKTVSNGELIFVKK